MKKSSPLTKTIQEDQPMKRPALPKFDSSISTLTLNEMPDGDIQFIATHSGIDVARKLLSTVAGQTARIPRRGILAKRISMYALKHFNGHNAPEISRQCQCDVTTIYRIVREEDRRKLALRGSRSIAN